MEFLASKYRISKFNFFFQFKPIPRVNLPETGNNRRVPAWLIPESSWWWWWWLREFWTGSVAWCCRVHGNSMMEFFEVDTLVGKGLSRGGSHRKTLCHYIITYPKIAILGSKSVNHSALPIIVPSSFANKQRKGGGGRGKIRKFYLSKVEESCNFHKIVS